MKPTDYEPSKPKAVYVVELSRFSDKMSFQFDNWNDACAFMGDAITHGKYRVKATVWQEDVKDDEPEL